MRHERDGAVHGALFERRGRRRGDGERSGVGGYAGEGAEGGEGDGGCLSVGVTHPRGEERPQLGLFCGGVGAA